MTREICNACWRPNPVGFNVPDETWELVVPARIREGGNKLCIMCFAQFADERLIEWDREIEFYPVSMVTHLTDYGNGPGADLPPALVAQVLRRAT